MRLFASRFLIPNTKLNKRRMPNLKSGSAEVRRQPHRGRAAFIPVASSTGILRAKRRLQIIDYV